MNSYSCDVDGAIFNDLIKAFNFSQYRFIPFSKLSSGNRKKASLIAVFSLQVPVLLLDEPTDFLDFSATEFFYELVLLRKEQDLSTIISSHIAQIFTRCCDYVYVLEDKRLSERKSIPENPDRVVSLLHSSVSQFR